MIVLEEQFSVACNQIWVIKSGFYFLIRHHQCNQLVRFHVFFHRSWFLRLFFTFRLHDRVTTIQAPTHHANVISQSWIESIRTYWILLQRLDWVNDSLMALMAFVTTCPSHLALPDTLTISVDLQWFIFSCARSPTFVLRTYRDISLTHSYIFCWHKYR